mgnify:CR=1 FL=1
MYSLLPYNTFGIDVSAARFLEYSSVEELKKLIVQGAVTTPFLHIGGGSNLLFTKDYDGLILHSRIEGIEVTEEDDRFVSVRVGAGVVWDDFVAYCVEHGWYGAENLSLIPGEVGASAVQNIGAYGVEVKDLITAVETVNIQAEERVYLVEECGYTYRNSIFKRPENKATFVTYVRFRLSKEEHYTLDYGTIRQELEKYPSLTLSVVRKVIIAIRESKLPDPKVLGNAGSFFKNPVVSQAQADFLTKKYPDMPRYATGEGRVKLAAGWLIDKTGLKGYKRGRVGVHERQALVLVNLGGATGGEVIDFAHTVQMRVHEKFGIEIDTEVNIF